MLVPVGRLEIFVSFMKAAREQVGRKQVAKRLRCGGGQGGRAGRTLGGGAKKAAQVAKERLEQVWAARTTLPTLSPAMAAGGPPCKGRT